MKVIVGQSDLWPTPAIASKILTIMVSNEGDFGVRGRRTGEWTSMIEEMASRIGNRIGRDVVMFRPPDAMPSAGFRRDVSLVKAANEVFAFFGPEGPVEGGTAHVVSCALRGGIPVVAFGLDEDGSILEIGSDGGELYEHYPSTLSSTLHEASDSLEIGWQK